MSTTKQIKVYKGVTTAIKARAKGYWDEVVFDTFTTNGESKNLTMSLYDGLNYSTSLSPLGTVKLDFSGTVLPYKWQYKNYLANLKYCFKPSGQNYGVEYITYNTFTRVGSPTVNLNSGIISGFQGRNHISIVTSKSFSAGTINSLEIACKIHTPTSWTSNGRIYNSTSEADAFVIEITQSRPLFKIGSAIVDLISSDIQSDKDYWFKAVYDGTNLKGYYSEDGETFVEYQSVQASSSDLYITDKLLDMGQRSWNSYANANITVWNGSIDLNGCYIKVNDEIIWSGIGSASYNNFQIIGTPQINQATGIVRNFSSSNYLRTLESFSPENKPWRIKMKFTTGSSVTNKTIIGSAYTNNRENFLIRINSNSKMWFLVSSSNGTWDIIGTTTQGGYTFLANTTYYCEASFNGTNYIFKYSTDGENYIEDINVASNSTIVAGKLEFGAHTFSGGTDTPFNGSIDLSGFSIEVNDEIWWKAGGENIENLPGITANYTDDGSAVTLNCFALGDESVVLTPDNNYGTFRLLGTVSIPAHTVYETATTLHKYDRVDNKATVVDFFTDNNSQRYALCVVDAQYRSTEGYKWSNSNEDFVSEPFATYEDTLTDTHTAKYYTDIVLNNYNITEFPAFDFAKNACSVTCDDNTYSSYLPTLNELLAIRDDAVTLDSYDPTLSAYSSNSLVNWSFGNAKPYIGICQEKNNNGDITSIVVSTNGYQGGRAKTTTRGVCPVIEIPVDANGTVVTS